MSATTAQWILILASSGLLLWIAPWARDKAAFFQAKQGGKSPQTWALLGSLVISWLFAKSITNAANLGYSYGLVGGVAYAAYYFSFAVVGLVIYKLRTEGGFKSLHHYLGDRFGRTALWIFSLLIALRLFQEVWSNTMVIGGYFGDRWTFEFYAAILVFTALTLAYSLKGGMSSSILTDLIQLGFFGVLLIVILVALLPASPGGLNSYLGSGEWSMAQGGNLLLLAIIQSLSYPFHDPVLTDRAFISNPKSTRKAFLWATPVGALGIILFSFVGIYGQQKGLTGSSDAPVFVARSFGLIMMLIMNFIMVTSAASTLDSTFASFSKLAVVDMGNPSKITVSRGRLTMIIVAILGSLPILLRPDIITATTLSGTMVIGLAPVFLLWRLKTYPVSFYLSVGIGLVLGVILLLGWFPKAWVLTEGKYSTDLTVNLIGLLLCFLGYLLPFWIMGPNQKIMQSASPLPQVWPLQNRAGAQDGNLPSSTSSAQLNLTKSARWSDVSEGIPSLGSSEDQGPIGGSKTSSVKNWYYSKLRLWNQ